MIVSNNVKEMIDFFEHNKGECKKMFCTTCGGKAHAVRAALGNAPQKQKALDEIIDGADNYSMLEVFGEWLELFSYIYENRVQALVGSHATVNLARESSIRDLDQFIFKNRHFISDLERHQSFYQEAVLRAIVSKDVSLTETLLLALGEKALKFQAFVEGAISLKDEGNIAKILYNKLREQMPEVRKLS
ncbi:MAG: hypothetical protein AB7E49_06595 [Campylobacterales bacterium]